VFSTLIISLLRFSTFSVKKEKCWATCLEQTTKYTDRTTHCLYKYDSCWQCHCHLYDFVSFMNFTRAVKWYGNNTMSCRLLNIMN